MNEIHEHPVFRRIAHADVSALMELYREHAQVLYNFATRVLHPTSDAGGAVVDLFLSLRTESHPTSPIQGATRNELISRMRGLLGGQTPVGTCRYQKRDVDLWSLVSRPVAEKEAAGETSAGDAHSVASVRWILRKSGSVSSAVLSLVYFGGLGIAAAAARLSINPAECRSRLHGCLEMLSVNGPVRRERRPDHARYSVCSSANSLGAITPAEEPEYFHHLAGGCPECDADISRFATAANILPMLLPDSKLPRELSDRLHAAIKAEKIPAAGPPATQEPSAGVAARTTGAEAATGETAGWAARVAESTHERASTRTLASRGDPQGFRVMVAITAVVAIVSLGIYARTLLTRLDDQAILFDALQDRQAERLLERDALAGIPGFYESTGIVTVLAGSSGYPGGVGKLVWDTTLGRGMLQLNNLPADAGDWKFQVRVAGEGLSMPITEFRPGGRDTGGVFYRFFELPKGVPFPPEAITVVASGGDANDPGENRTIFEGTVTARR